MIVNDKSAIVLEGGAVRGVFTAGVLDCLMEHHIEFPYVVGVSAGACNALAYVSKQIGRTYSCMCPDKEHTYRNSIKDSIKMKSIFNMDMIFDEYPKNIYPFDFDVFKTSNSKCEMVVTNCRTGRAEYMSETYDVERLLNICRASSSLPVLSPIVKIDGVPYLDGGMADSIPIMRAIKKGYKRNVLILTRNKGYRKRFPDETSRAYIAAFKQYPNLVKAIYYRPYVYNKTMSLIERLEDAGKLYVIRPTVKCPGRTEKSYVKLGNFYRHGHKVMEENMEELLRFLDR